MNAQKKIIVTFFKLCNQVFSLLHFYLILNGYLFSNLFSSNLTRFSQIYILKALFIKGLFILLFTAFYVYV